MDFEQLSQTTKSPESLDSQLITRLKRFPPNMSVSEVILELERKIQDYSKGTVKISEEARGEKEVNLDNIISIANFIESQFSRVDIDSNRNFEQIRSFFLSKLTGFEVTEKGRAVYFKDQKGNVFIHPYTNTRLPEELVRFFNLTGAYNVPINSVGAVAILNGDKIIRKGDLNNL
jgi:hypothetical protein